MKKTINLSKGPKAKYKINNLEDIIRGILSRLGVKEELTGNKTSMDYIMKFMIKKGMIPEESIDKIKQQKIISKQDIQQIVENMKKGKLGTRNYIDIKNGNILTCSENDGYRVIVGCSNDESGNIIIRKALYDKTGIKRLCINTYNNGVKIAMERKTCNEDNSCTTIKVKRSSENFDIAYYSETKENFGQESRLEKEGIVALSEENIHTLNVSGRYAGKSELEAICRTECKARRNTNLRDDGR